MTDEQEKTAPPPGHGPARVGDQDYKWARLTRLAVDPWCCGAIPALDGSDVDAAGGRAADLRRAIDTRLALIEHRRGVQVLEQRAHLVEFGEQDAAIPWHAKDLDTRGHRAALWLLHAGAGLFERRAGGGEKALLAGGRLLRLMFADRRVRSAVDREDLVLAALALAAGGDGAAAAEAIASVRTDRAMDALLVPLLQGDRRAALRAAQGLGIRRGTRPLDAELAAIVGHLLGQPASAGTDAGAVAQNACKQALEHAANDCDVGGWWRARLLRIVAGSMHACPVNEALTLNGDGAKSLDRADLAGAIAALSRLAPPGLAVADRTRLTALQACFSGRSAVVGCDDPFAAGQLLAGFLMPRSKARQANLGLGVAVLVARDTAQARAAHAFLSAASGPLSRIPTHVLTATATGRRTRTLRAGDIVIGTPTALVAALSDGPTPSAERPRITRMVALGGPGGISDVNIGAEVAFEALLARALQDDAIRLLIAPNDRRLPQLTKWWRAKKPAALVPRAVRLRRGVLFIAEARVRIAWRDAVGSLQAAWFDTVHDADSPARTFPTGRSEAVAAAAVRLSRLAPAVVVCAAPRAMLEVVRGCMVAARLREAVVRPHGWPHDAWQRFDRAARDAGLDAERVTAAHDGFPSWCATDTDAVKLAAEELIASAPARVAVVDLELSPSRIAPFTHLLVTGSSAEARRLDPARVAEYARHAGRHGLDRQGTLLVAVDGRRAQEQVVRDIQQADALLEVLDTAAPASGVELAARAIAGGDEAEAAFNRRLLETALGAREISDPGATLAAVIGGREVAGTLRSVWSAGSGGQVR